MSFHRPFLEAESCVRRLGLDMVLKMLATSLTQMLSQLKELCTFSTSQVQKPWLRIRLEPRVRFCGPGRSTGWHGRAWCDYAPGPKFLLAGKRHDSLTPVVTQKNNDDSRWKSLLISKKGLWGGLLWCHVKRCCGRFSMEFTSFLKTELVFKESLTFLEHVIVFS